MLTNEGINLLKRRLVYVRQELETNYQMLDEEFKSKFNKEYKYHDSQVYHTTACDILDYMIKELELHEAYLNIENIIPDNLK